MGSDSRNQGVGAEAGTGTAEESPSGAEAAEDSLDTAEVQEPGEQARYLACPASNQVPAVPRS